MDGSESKFIAVFSENAELTFDLFIKNELINGSDTFF
jgi:hypothetical protein